jgi:hypothetical protein
MSLLYAVQVEIQFYYVHARFAQQAQRAAFRMAGDQFPDGGDFHCSGFCHSGDWYSATAGLMWASRQYFTSFVAS